MLPQSIKFRLFDHMSTKTMRYVTAIPQAQAQGLTKKVYDMIREDFFINGSLTSRSKVPTLMAAIWTAGREAMLVEDKVDRTLKDAICAVLSQINDCPYCEDMLVSLVHAGGDHDAAHDIFRQNDLQTTETHLAQQLAWTRAVAGPGTHDIPPLPFTAEQLPEVFGSLMAMSDINRFSHVVMASTPVNAPLGLDTVKEAALRVFGSELTTTRQVPLQHGRALDLLPPATLPDVLDWAAANPRVADAIARWTATVQEQAQRVISPAVQHAVATSLDSWQGEIMPISRSWVNADVAELDGADKTIAELTIVLAKAPYQVDETMSEKVLACCANEEDFIRVLAWASYTGARRVIQLIADRSQWRTQTGSRAAA